ncbi:hypothetical protein KJ612_10170 [Myxococcota bacterium]|nr:hypothetical protein [Myxococcota bacterium]
MQHSRLLAMTFLLVLGVCGPAAAQYQIELTFDDGDDFSSDPELNNLETGTGVTARLEGTARRSGLHEGRHGRAVDFPAGGGFVSIAGWTPQPDFIALLWVAARSAAAGDVLHQGGRWRLKLIEGELGVEFFRSDGSSEISVERLPWPDDGGFHHLTVVASGMTSLPSVTVTLDFTDTLIATAPGSLGAEDGTLHLGEGLDGMLDELVVANRPTATLSAEQDRFNRDPDYCPEGTVCMEEGFSLVPRTFVREVPVRFKSVYDPLLCTDATPCPLLFAIQGGSACANDYAMPVDVVPMVRAGFVVVTIDPYCEGNGQTYVPETEVSQFVAVKEHVFAAGAVAPLVSGPEYHATGCSHGAEAVLVWAMREPDHPLRTFARSGGVSGLCARVAGELCAYLGGTNNLGVDVESGEVRTYHEDTDMVGRVTHETVATREVARSWGVNLEGPRCPSGGLPGCQEEGLWGMTYGSRRFATVWRVLESPWNPTGYFVEDVGADCRHCAPAGSVAFECGLCLLRHGRAGMNIQCPECLYYDDPTIRRPEPGATCPLEATWYWDPLGDGGIVDADADGDADPIYGDIPSDADDPPPGKSGGCSCRTGLTGDPGGAGYFGLFITAFLVTTRRRRAGRRPA